MYHAEETENIRQQGENGQRMGDIRHWGGKKPAKHPFRAKSPMRRRHINTLGRFINQKQALWRTRLANGGLSDIVGLRCGFDRRLSCLVGQGGGERGQVCARQRARKLLGCCPPRDQLFCRRRYSPANSTRAGSTEMKMIMRITREKFCLTKARLPKK